MKLIQLSTFVFILILTPCGTPNKEEVTDASKVAEESNSFDRVWSEDEIDYHTLSNYMDVYVSHIHLDVEISFDEKKIIR